MKNIGWFVLALIICVLWTIPSTTQDFRSWKTTLPLPNGSPRDRIEIQTFETNLDRCYVASYANGSLLAEAAVSVSISCIKK